MKYVNCGIYQLFLCLIGAPDAVEEIHRNRILSMEAKIEDIKFYHDQKGDRLAVMSGHDKKYETKFDNRQKSSLQFELRRERGEFLRYHFDYIFC